MTTAKWFTTPVVRAAIAIACIPITAHADEQTTPAATTPSVATADTKAQELEAKPSVTATLPPAEPPPSGPH